MPTEGYTAQEIQSKFGLVREMLPAPTGHFHTGLSAGQFTDDTEETLLLAESLIDASGSASAMVARSIARATGGIPIGIVELAKLVREETDAGRTVAVLESVDQAIQTRLARLPAMRGYAPGDRTTDGQNRAERECLKTCVPEQRIPCQRQTLVVDNQPTTPLT